MSPPLSERINYPRYFHPSILPKLLLVSSETPEARPIYPVKGHALSILHVFSSVLCGIPISFFPSVPRGMNANAAKMGTPRRGPPLM